MRISDWSSDVCSSDLLEHALGRLVALQEAYPDLKASENFAQLQRDLVEVEEHLQYARRFYNGAVRDYNDAVQRVPDLLVARSFNFEAAEFFQADDDGRAAVNVELSRRSEEHTSELQSLMRISYAVFCLKKKKKNKEHTTKQY